MSTISRQQPTHHIFILEIDVNFVAIHVQRQKGGG